MTIWGHIITSIFMTSVSVNKKSINYKKIIMKINRLCYPPLSLFFPKIKCVQDFNCFSVLFLSSSVTWESCFYCLQICVIYHNLRTVLDLREFLSLQSQQLSTDFKINVLCILSVTGASLVFRDVWNSSHIWFGSSNFEIRRLHLKKIEHTGDTTFRREKGNKQCRKCNR